MECVMLATKFAIYTDRIDGVHSVKWRDRSPSPDVMDLIKDISRRSRQSGGKKHVTVIFRLLFI